jgi:hypothetical protein
MESSNVRGGRADTDEWMEPFLMIRSWMRYTTEAMAATTKKASPIITLIVWSGYQYRYVPIVTSWPGCREAAMKASTKAATGRKKAASTTVFFLRTKGMKANDEKRISILIAWAGVAMGNCPVVCQRVMTKKTWQATQAAYNILNGVRPHPFFKKR